MQQKKLGFIVIWATLGRSLVEINSQKEGVYENQLRIRCTKINCADCTQRAALPFTSNHMCQLVVNMMLLVKTLICNPAF